MNTSDRSSSFLQPDHLTPHLTPLHTSPSPHPLLVARGLTGADLSGCAYILTKQAAQLLREARAFKYAAEGDLALPVYDAAGQLAGWRLWPSPSKVSPSPKRLAALKDCGWQSSGVVWADAMGLDVLRRGAEAEAEVLLIAEGEPDALTLRAWVDAFSVGARMRGAVGVIGLCGAGAWSPELGARLTQWAEGAGRLRGCVFVMTDRDKAGERYAAQVKASLDASVTAYRTAGKAGRADLNGLWRAEGGEALWALMEGAAEMPPLPSAEAGRWLWSDDAAGWAEDPSWTARRDRDRARAEASRGRARVAEVDASSPELLERAQAFVEAGLAACLDTLRGLEGAREAALRAIAPIASCVAGGALERGRVESELLAAYVRGDRETQADRRALIRSALNRRVREPRSLNDVAQTLALRDQAKGGASRWKRAEVAPDKRRGASPRLTANDATPQPVAEAVSVGRESAGGGVGAGEGAEVGAVEGAGHGLRVSLPAYKGQPAIEAVEQCPPLSPSVWVEGGGVVWALVDENGLRLRVSRPPSDAGHYLFMPAPSDGVEVIEAVEVVAAVEVEGLQPLDDGTGWQLCARWLPRHLFAQLGEAWRTVVLRSPQNTGKTEVLKPLIAAAKAAGQRVLILTHRRELARGLAARLGAGCYLDRQGCLTIKPGEALVLSIDSLHKLTLREGESRAPDLVIIDESEQATRHLFGNTIKDLRLTSNCLFAVLRQARRVVFADADAGPLTHQLATSCAGRTQGLLNVHNTWREWSFSASCRVDVLMNRHKAGRMQLWAAVVETVRGLKAGERIHVTCTAKAQAEEIAGMLRAEGLGEGVLLVTSDTRGEPDAARFLSDPNANMPRVLINTSCIGTGVSLDEPVKRVFACISSNVQGFTGADAVQMMTRARKQAQPPLVWLGGRTYRNMPRDMETARAQAARLIDESDGLIQRTKGVSQHLRDTFKAEVARAAAFDGEGESAKLYNLQLACEVETGRGGWDLANATLEKLAERGAEVVEVDGVGAGEVEVMKDAAKAARGQADDAQAQLVCDVEAPPAEKLDKLRQLGTRAAEAQVTRFEMERRGVEVVPATARAAVVDGALGKGRALAEAAAQARGGTAAVYAVESAARDVMTCPARRDTMRSVLQAEWTARMLEAVGLAEVLKGGAGGGEGWAVDIGESARLEALRAFLDAHREALEAAGFSLPKAGCAPHLVREWLINRLGGLGVEVTRPAKRLGGGARARGKGGQAYSVTQAAVAEAWRWAARPFSDLVETAELDEAGWAAAGVSR